MARDKATQILRLLKKDFTLPAWTRRPRDPFQTLIRTMLSQATASRNASRAFENLSRRFPISPDALVEVKENEIEQAIRVAGLYRNKAKVIKALSCAVLEEHKGSLDFIRSLPLEEARRTLMSLPGVGPKTADVVLLFSTRRPTIPVDTHVRRVSKRLGLAPADADYENVRKALQSAYPPTDYLPVHLLLIALGRKYCKARRPICGPCPVNTLCPSSAIGD